MLVPLRVLPSGLKVKEHACECRLWLVVGGYALVGGSVGKGKRILFSTLKSNY